MLPYPRARKESAVLLVDVDEEEPGLPEVQKQEVDVDELARAREEHRARSQVQPGVDGAGDVVAIEAGNHRRGQSCMEQCSLTSSSILFIFSLFFILLIILLSFVSLAPYTLCTHMKMPLYNPDQFCANDLWIQGPNVV